MAVATFDAVVATPREGKFNKNAARRVRVAGKIPAVVYGAGQDAIAVTVDPKTITITASPGAPVPMLAIAGAAMGAYDTLPDLLALDVKANQ